VAGPNGLSQLERSLLAALFFLACRRSNKAAITDKNSGSRHPSLVAALGNAPMEIIEAKSTEAVPVEVPVERRNDHTTHSITFVPRMRPDVRFGSLADIAAELPNVRFVPLATWTVVLKSSPISVGLFPPKWLCRLMRSVVTRNTEIA